LPAARLSKDVAVRIEPGQPGIPSVPGRKPTRGSRNSATAPRPASDQTSEAAISAENAALMSALDDVPDVRPEVLEEVRERLKRGEYLSRDAAEKTAAVMLADLASFIGQ
jgi:hypothetical protein